MVNPLPGIPLQPCPICFGTAQFSPRLSPDRSFALLDSYVEQGGNFLDTAPVYSAWVDEGWGSSERTIGDWLQARGARKSIILATKGGHPPWGSQLDTGLLSPADLDRDVNESLARLRVDRIDLYWLHRDEPARPVGEIIETLAGLVRDGRIRTYGASNWTTARIEEANSYARAHQLPPFVASQPWFSLAAVARGAQSDSPTREDDDPLRAWHLRSRLPLLPYSSQANGYFGADNVAWAHAGFEGAPPRAERFDSPANRRRLQRAVALARHKGVTANQVALAYLLSQPFPVFPIIGTGNLDHLREAMSARDLRLTPDEIASLFS